MLDLTPYKGFYFAGDGCYRDKDGYYWITGRVDDVLNISGLCTHVLVMNEFAFTFSHDNRNLRGLQHMRRRHHFRPSDWNS